MSKRNEIYDDYAFLSSEYEKEARQYLFDEYGEFEDWESPEDISDTRVYDEIDVQRGFIFEDEMEMIKSFFEDKQLLVCGSCGLWYGRVDGGKVITVDNLSDLWNDCGMCYIHLYDENGHFFVEVAHHDGTNCFEVKVLTEKGYEIYSDWEYDYRYSELSEREIHEKLWNDSHYTHIPHYAREVFGVKTR